MSELGVRIARDTLQTLIRQFSDEMAFLRELVQNALDANSAEVDVDVRFEEAHMRATIAVTDYGEGMTRDIIDSKLTRLFASSKEDDFTKIGKFGIGFVSVFAIAPQAVTVDTGRSGESWRVLFKPDGTFERIRLPQPVEGTCVTLYKQMTVHAFDKLRHDARGTLAYWCRHAQATIRFNGEPINEAFDLPCPVKARASDGFTEVVAGLSDEEKPFFGFYNHGLTLLEGHAATVPGVTFKIKSKYLEHTLTRDNVMKDANYEKAMKTLRRLVDTDLRQRLVDDLAKAAADGDTEAYHRAAADRAPYLAARWDAWGRKVPLVPTLDARRVVSLADLERSAVTLARLQSPRAHVDAVLFQAQASALTTALQQRDVAVLSTETATALRPALEARGFRLMEAGEATALATPVSTPLGAVGRRLLDETLAVLGTCRVKLTGVEAVRLEASRKLLERLAVVVQRSDGYLLTSVTGGALGEDERPPRWPMSLRSRGRLLVNLEHPLVVALLELAALDVQAAAYALAKTACLADGLHPQMEDRLLAAHSAGPAPSAPTSLELGLLEDCLRTGLANLRLDDGLLDPRVDVASLGAGAPLVAFKGMRVVLNADHPYRATSDAGTFRLASAVFTCYNVALDRVRDDHELEFLQALTHWLIARPSQ